MSDIKGRRDALQGEIVHEYDGIEEADNFLPRWWIAVFVGTIGFGIAYWLGYQVYALKPSPAEEYALRQDALLAARVAAARDAPEVSADVLATLAHDTHAVAEGAAIFKQNCVACHGERGEGKIGPNLTDHFWLHGGAPLAIHKTIEEGVPAKGMPTWGPLLGKQGVEHVAAFVLSIHDTEVPGKAPQGEAAAL